MTKAMFSTVRSRTLSLLMAGAAMAGCATLPSKIDHAALLAATNYATTNSFAVADRQWPADRWWANYGDPQLDTLIDEGLRGAPDLRIAIARIHRAEAIAKQEGAKLLPTLDANASAQELKQSYSMGLPAPRGWNDTGRATLDFSWEIDFWGKNRAAVRAATSDLEAARAESAAARVAISTSVATAYADYAALAADRDALTDALKVRQRSTALIRDRQANGLENMGAVARAQSAEASAEGDLAATDENIAITQDRIAALVGAGPDRGRALGRPTIAAPQTIGLPASLPAELISRRGDIVAARARTESAASRIKVAKASFYPNVSLTAFLGLQSLTLGSFANSGSLIGSAGPAVSLPIFNGGRLRGKYREAEANYDEAVAQYDGAVVQALRDVADSAASGTALVRRLDRAQAAQASASRAYEVANNRYRGGLATYLDVLTAEDALIITRRQVANLETRGFTLDVALIRALGGGFRDAKGA